MKIIRYAGLEYKHSSKPTHLYHVERDGLHYLLYYKGGGSLSYDAIMTGTPAEVDAAFDQKLEFMGSGAYHSENWNVATETPDTNAEKILGIFEHPTFGINWEKVSGGQSSEDQFCDMLSRQVKEWKGTAHALSVAKHPYWPRFHAMVKDAVIKEYGSSIRLYRGIRGEQASTILDGIPSKNRRATAWTSDLSSARVYAAGKTKRGNIDWVVVRRNFSPEEILLAPVELEGPCDNPDILMMLMRDVEHYGDEFIVDLPEFIPGDFKIAAKPRGIKMREGLLREYIGELLLTEYTPARIKGKKTIWRGMKLTIPSASVASQMRKRAKGTIESESFDREMLINALLDPMVLRGESLGESWSLSWNVATSFADAFGATNRGKILHVIFEALVDEEAGYDPQAAGEEFAMFYDEDEVRFKPGADIPLTGIYIYIAPKKDKWGYTSPSTTDWKPFASFSYDDPKMVKA